MVSPTRLKCDRYLIALRELGYTYEAIAYCLHLKGLTEKEVSRARIQFLLNRAAPHLKGLVKRRLSLKRLIRKDEIVSGSIIPPEAI